MFGHCTEQNSKVITFEAIIKLSENTNLKFTLLSV